MPRFTLPLPLGGLDDREPTVIGPEKWSNTRNIRSRRQRIEKGPGTSALGSGTIIGTPNFITSGNCGTTLNNSSTIAFLLTTSNIYQFTGGVWSSIDSITVPSGERSVSTDVTDIINSRILTFFANRNILHYFDGFGIQTTVILPTGLTTLASKFLATFNDRLVLVRTTEDGNDFPTRIRWSSSGFPTNFDDGDIVNQGAGFLEAKETSASPISSVGVLGERCFIFKEREVIELIPTGLVDSVFRQITRISGNGCLFPYSWAAAEEIGFFVGPDNVYMFDGTNMKSIGDPIYRTLFNLVDPTLASGFGAVNQSDSEYWLFWMGSGIHTFFIYDYRFDKWYRDDYGGTPTCMGSVPAVTTDASNFPQGRTQQIILGLSSSPKRTVQIDNTVTTQEGDPYEVFIETSDSMPTRVEGNSKTVDLSSTGTLWEVRGQGTPGHVVEVGIQARPSLSFSFPITVKIDTTSPDGDVLDSRGPRLIRSSGSWIDDGFRIGDILTFFDVGSNNGGTDATRVRSFENDQVMYVDGGFVTEGGPFASANVSIEGYITQEVTIDRDGLWVAYFEVPFTKLRLRLRSDHSGGMTLLGAIDVRWTPAGSRPLANR